LKNTNSYAKTTERVNGWGGIYHGFNRGNNRHDLFCDQEDAGTFLGYLYEIKNKLSADIYHFCLMTNHFHFLMQVKKGDDLSKVMHSVQLGYARYFKRKYRFVGHVFQERFRSPLIDGEAYYLQCGRYIERNPVKAGMVDKAWDYEWTSAKYYAAGEKNAIITPNPYYAGMGPDDVGRQENYRRFLAIEDAYSKLIDEVLTKC